VAMRAELGRMASDILEQRGVTMARQTHRRNFLPRLECLESRWLMAGLLHQPDLSYLGAFKVPSGRLGVSRFDHDIAGNLAVSGGFSSAASASSPVYSYLNPPPLPPSNPATTVSVSNVSQLISAINNLQTGQTISLAGGTYDLSGVTDALYIPQGISNWTIRGSSGNRADVVIQGAGMNGAVRFGFWMGNAPGATIADLTIRNMRSHGIIMNPGAHNFLCHNVEMVDIGDQFIKSNPVSFGNGNDNGVVEYSVFRFTTNEAGAGGTPNYSQGVDVHAGDNWLIRYNKFENIFAPTGGGVWGMAAILVWNGSQNTIVEGNVFVNNARDVILGLEDKAAGNDHTGGVIRNNAVYRSASSQGTEWDVPIGVADSPNTKVYHNTVLINGSFPYGIDYRFPATTNVDIRNNLMDAGIRQRDGATGLVANNVTNASAVYFTAPASGDLHLLSSASAAIDKGVALAGETYDMDGLVRPHGSAPDIGADEFGNTTAPPSDTTPPTISDVATSNLSSTRVTIGWSTNEASDTQVEYGTTASYGNSTTLNTALVTNHAVNLTGLAANTTYYYRVKSRDAAGNLRVSSDFTFTTAPASTAFKQIIDDGWLGNRRTGTWRRVTGKGYANDIQIASKGTGSTQSRWTFWSLPSGQYQIWATWKISSINATNAPYTIYDGPTALQTTRVNQRVPPSGLWADGALWKLLGTVTVNSGRLVVKLTNAANNQVVADAIRIESVPAPIAPALLPTDAPESEQPPLSSKAKWSSSLPQDFASEQALLGEAVQLLDQLEPATAVGSATQQRAADELALERLLDPADGSDNLSPLLPLLASTQRR
jgi:hypothetical protein